MTEKSQFKIWTSTPKSRAGVMVTPDTSYLVGSPKNYVAVGGQGVAIVGKSVSIGVSSENLRQGGLFINTNDFMKLIPSNMWVPIPSQIPFPPLGAITFALGDIAFFMAIMAK